MTAWSDLFAGRDHALSKAELKAGKNALLAYMDSVRPAASKRPSEHMAHASSPFQSAAGASLSAKEIGEGRASLRHFIAAHPVHAKAGLFSHFLRSAATPTFAAAFLLATGGGAVYAAEGSMPGDFLYPVKIAVNERAIAQLYAGDAGKALWSVKKLERRAREAATLARLNSRDGAVWQALSALTDDAREDLEQRMEMLSPEVAAGIRADLAVRLAPFTAGAHDEVGEAERSVFAALRKTVDSPSVALENAVFIRTMGNANTVDREHDTHQPAPQQGASTLSTSQDAAVPQAEELPSNERVPPMADEPAPAPMMLKVVPAMQGTEMMMEMRMMEAPKSSSRSVRSSTGSSLSTSSLSTRESSSAHTSSEVTSPPPHAPSPAPEEVPPDAQSAPSL